MLAAPSPKFVLDHMEISAIAVVVCYRMWSVSALSPLLSIDYLPLRHEGKIKRERHFAFAVRL